MGFSNKKISNYFEIFFNRNLKNFNFDTDDENLSSPMRIQ